MWVFPHVRATLSLLTCQCGRDQDKNECRDEIPRHNLPWFGDTRGTSSLRFLPVRDIGFTHDSIRKNFKDGRRGLRPFPWSAVLWMCFVGSLDVKDVSSLFHSNTLLSTPNFFLSSTLWHQILQMDPWVSVCESAPKNTGPS